MTDTIKHTPDWHCGVCEFDRVIEARDKALRSMDWAKNWMPGAACDEIRLIAMHKARIEVTSMPEGLKIESKKWLTDRGYKLFFY